MNTWSDPFRVTIDTLAAGVDRELSRVLCRRRGIIFARLGNGEFGLITVAVDRDGEVSAVQGVVRMTRDELNELDHALVAARKAFAQ